MFKFFTSKKQTYLFLLAIILLSIACYYPALQGQFLNWGDEAHVTQNTAIRSLDGESLGKVLTQRVNYMYMPLTTLSFAIKNHFVGLNPQVFHATNIVLHIINCLLVFVLIQYLGFSRMVGVLSAGLFAIHPIHVESVAWITARKDVLYALFYLLALISYCKYLKYQDDKKLAKRLLILTTLLGVLSMLSKAMAVSLPLVLLLIDWYSRRKINVKALVEKAPLAIAIGLIALKTLTSLPSAVENTMIERILILVWTSVYYIRQFFLPLISLPIVRLPADITIGNPEYLLSLILLLVIFVSIFVFRKHRIFIFSVLLYGVSTFFLWRTNDVAVEWGPNIVAERFLYLPSLGFIILIAIGFQKLLSSDKKSRNIVGLILCSTLAVTCIMRSNYLTVVWQNSINLWQHQTKFVPKDSIALNSLASAIRQEEIYWKAASVYKSALKAKNDGYNLEASAHLIEAAKIVEHVEYLFKESIKADPEYVFARYNLGKFYSELGLYEDAIKSFDGAIAIDPTYYLPRIAKAMALIEIGKLRKSLMQLNALIAKNQTNEDLYANLALVYDRLIAENPDESVLKAQQEVLIKKYNAFVQTQSPTSRSYYNLGKVYFNMKAWDKARAAYEMAIQLNPRNEDALYNLGNLYKQAGEEKRAIELYEKTINVNPQHIGVYLNLGNIYGDRKEFEKAKIYYKKAISNESGYVKAYLNLGIVEELSGNTDEALKQYKKAIDLEPNYVPAYDKLGVLYGKLRRHQDAIATFRKLVEIDQNHMLSWVNLTLLSLKEKDTVSALKYYDEAILLGFQPPYKLKARMDAIRSQSSVGL